jgi:uncharacterized protein YciI
MRTILSLVLAATFAITLAACASNNDAMATDTPRAEAPNKDAWVYMIRLRDMSLLERASEDEQAMFAGHFAYLQDLTRKGVVIVAGPCTDMIGPGIVIFEAPDEAAARKIMLDDPGVAGGVFTAQLHPMRLSLLRERDMPKP